MHAEERIRLKLGRNAFAQTFRDFQPMAQPYDL
jgi:hypothetical protein